MKKRLFITGLCLLSALGSINAFTAKVEAAEITETSAPGIQPYSNVTGYLYKVENGKTYRRLWSYTYNRWEEANWTLVG